MTFCYPTSWAIEIYIGGSWVNVTADIRASNGVTGSRGIMRNDNLSRVADPGYLTFYMDNSAANSAGLAGYYSPGHTNCLVGWTTGLPVRLSFAYDGRTYYKWYGHIRPAGITVTPGEYGPRDCQVSCEDWMGLAQRHEVKQLSYATNKRIDEAIPLLHANMPIAPLATDLATGTDTYPTVFDMAKTTTTAWGEYQKMALSERSYIYPTGDWTGGETLKSEASTTRSGLSVLLLPVPSDEAGYLLMEDGGALLAEDGGYILLDETQAADFSSMARDVRVSYGATKVNRVNVNAYPRKVLTGVGLTALNKSFKIEAGQTLPQYRMSYRDPDNLLARVSCVPSSMSTSATATANEDGSGASMTTSLSVTAVYGTEAVYYTLTNTNTSTALWVQTLTATGNGVSTYDPITQTVEDATDQASVGVIAITADMKYQNDALKAAALASYIISSDLNPKTTVDGYTINANRSSVALWGFLLAEPGTLVTISEAQTGISGNYYVNGYSFNMRPGAGGAIIDYTLVLKQDPGFYPRLKWGTQGGWGTGTWG